MTEFYIIDNPPMIFFAGPPCPPRLTEEEEEIQKGIRYYQERSKHCCRICGIYLEINERNEKNLCSMCILKKTDKENCLARREK